MRQDNVIVEYWNVRSDSYSATVRQELENDDYPAWCCVFENHLAGIRGQGKRVLDLGCGPGFFSIILAQMGFTVDAVDVSSEMLSQARANTARAGVIDAITFHEEDATILPFPDNTFSAVVMRNVTWLMQNPEDAYREWQRVLAPGGKLLIFDANWYRYLDDESIDQMRRIDQSDPSILTWSEEALATPAQESRCEEIAAKLPFTYIDRPAWDLYMLDYLGFDAVFPDDDKWITVCPQGDQKFYASSPMFMVSATK